MQTTRVPVLQRIRVRFSPQSELYRAERDSDRIIGDTDAVISQFVAGGDRSDVTVKAVFAELSQRYEAAANCYQRCIEIVGGSGRTAESAREAQAQMLTYASREACNYDKERAGLLMLRAQEAASENRHSSERGTREGANWKLFWIAFDFGDYEGGRRAAARLRTGRPDLYRIAGTVIKEPRAWTGVPTVPYPKWWPSGAGTAGGPTPALRVYAKERGLSSAPDSLGLT